MALQSDGKVIIGGSFSSINSIARYGVARLRVDGSLDVNFRPSTFLGTTVNALAVQSDGKIVIAGIVSQYVADMGFTNTTLARLNSDGSVDGSFMWGTFITSGVSDMALMPNGKIFVAASLISVNGISRTNVARVNADGTIDTTFTADPMVGSPTQVLALTN